MKFKKTLSTLCVLILVLLLLQPAAYSADLSAQTEPFATVFTASDFQGGSKAFTNFETMLGTLKQNGYQTPDGMFFGGDYSDSSANTDAEPGTTKAVNILMAEYPEFDMNNALFVQGNHDAANGYITETGAYAFEYYNVYQINEDDYSSGHSSALVTATAEKLEKYLEYLVLTGDNKPVFIITHIPLHASTRSDNDYSKILFDVINEYGKKLDIVFMFGHNHSSKYDDYIGGSVNYIAKNETMLVPAPGVNYVADDETTYSEETLNFTYMNYGYIGYSNNSVSDVSTNTLTMGIFEFYADTLELTRYTFSGVYTTESIELINPYITSPYVKISGNENGIEGNSDILYGQYGNIDNPIFTWSSSDSSVAEVIPNGNNANVIYRSEGIAEITLKAEYNDGKSVEASFTVSVAEAEPLPAYTIYELVETPVVGEEYIIATEKAEGSAVIFANDITDNYLRYTTGNIMKENEFYSNSNPYIINSDDTNKWILENGTENGSFALKGVSNGKYLTCVNTEAANSTKMLSWSDEISQESSWKYTNGIVNIYREGRGLHYESDGYYRLSSTVDNLYFYERTDHESGQIMPEANLKLEYNDVSGETLRYYEASENDTIALTGTFNGFGEYSDSVNEMWMSSDDSVAKVNNGVVSFLSSGKAVITYCVSDGIHTVTKSVTFVISFDPRPVETYRLADNIEEGKTYILSSSNSEGVTRIVKNIQLDGGEGSYYRYRLAADVADIELISDIPCIVTDSEDIMWTAQKNSSGEIVLVGENGKALGASYTSSSATTTSHTDLCLSDDIDDVCNTVVYSDDLRINGYAVHLSSGGYFRADTNETQTSVYVFEKLVPYATLTIDGINADGTTRTINSVEAGYAETLVGSYGDFTGETVFSWESSNNEIASVENGVVTFTGIGGNVSISFTVKGANKEITCSVNYIVTAKSEPTTEETSTTEEPTTEPTTQEATTEEPITEPSTEETVTDEPTTTEPTTEAEDTSSVCKHLCHSSNWFTKIIWKIVNFIFRIFNINRICNCGNMHY